MKLDLTLPALERLIGGDTEMEIALRQQIVEEFTKRHLKTLVQDAAVKAMSAEYDKQIKTSLTAIIADLKRSYQVQADRIADGGAGLHDYYLWDIKKALEAALGNAVYRATEERVKSCNDYVTRTVDAAIRNFFRDEVRRRVVESIQGEAEIDRMIQEEIDKRIKDGIQRRLDAAAKLQ